MKIIVSYGGGTNSTAMLIGLKERGVTPDAITFADTGGEKPYTYEHINQVNNWCISSGFPEITILKGSMPQQIIDGTLENECLRLGTLPSKAYGYSSCADKWKMNPQRKYDKEFASINGISLREIMRMIGFDADEHSRVARGLELADRKPVNESYPLYEWGWGREDCIEAISRAGLKQPGKSACFFCPSSKKPEILELQKLYPDLLSRAIEIERKALAGEGRAQATTGKGLGRSFNWGAFLLDVGVSKLDINTAKLSDAGIPEMDCGCYDG